MCKSLRLAYVAEIHENIPFDSPEQFLEDLLMEEFRLREKAKVQRLIKNAKFLDSKSLINYEWTERIRFPTQIDKEGLMSIDFIKQKQNVVLIGAPGTGKSHLATGLGRKACEMGYEVRFYRVSLLIEQLEQALSQDKLPSFRKKFEKVDLVILDEMGYLPFSKEGSELLFQLIADWYEQKSLIITSNLEFSQWNRIFIDSRLTAALVDRLIHHAHVLTFNGGSYRLSGGGSIKKNGQLDKIQQLLSEANIETYIVEGIVSEPTVTMVQEGTAQLNEFRPDWVIGIGGGSPMDAAKAMWLFYEHPELTFEEAARPFTLPKLRTKAKFFGIPTTSRTAAEISNLSVITDEKTGIKYPLADFELTPDLAIIDPTLVENMPKHMIAYSGMNAVTHEIEAYVAKPRTIFTDSLAIEAAEVLKENLVESFQGDLNAREQVHYAQAMPGMSFANAVLGNVHSLAHKSGPTFNIPHGCANAIYLPYVIQFNRTVVEDRFAAIAKRLGLVGETNKELVDSLISWIRDLNRKMDIPSTLQEYGVTEEMFNKNVDEMAANAVQDPCTSTNPRETSVEEMKKLYQAAFYGQKVNF